MIGPDTRSVTHMVNSHMRFRDDDRAYDSAELRERLGHPEPGSMAYSLNSSAWYMRDGRHRYSETVLLQLITPNLPDAAEYKAQRERNHHFEGRTPQFRRAGVTESFLRAGK